MKRVVLLAAISALALFPAANVYAQAANQSSELKARTEERKARLKTKLDTATSQKIAGRCVAAQAKLKVVSAKLRETNDKYLPKYDEFIKKVETAEFELSNTGIKSSELLNQIGEAKKKYEAVKASAEKLQTSVDDASELDCKADPVGFKAAVDDARAEAKLLTEAKQELTKYARTTLKTTLQGVKAN
jgi:hypothetical protein